MKLEIWTESQKCVFIFFFSILKSKLKSNDMKGTHIIMQRKVKGVPRIRGYIHMSDFPLVNPIARFFIM